VQKAPEKMNAEAKYEAKALADQLISGMTVGKSKKKKFK
jgi:hypothetical protein